ncbi:MAG: DNA cytosine methyltransferase [Syntrophomonadaceae bacterium]|nr:DNA cytosine methyltransferase [Syntrophomonadaceae bacterium]
MRQQSLFRQYIPDSSHELVIDNFAGGGGASCGISQALGRSVDIAINHDPDAIRMHIANHPDTTHYCESVWDVDPREVTKGRPVGLVWLSPDCKHFSKAKGGKPVEKKIRGLAWVAVRWAATVKPRVIILENVEEFKTWGPLLKNNMPDPDKKGRTFNAFINALIRYGYQVEWRELRACDYGAPTIRKRFFLIARCDGQPIVWPEPTHGDPKSAAVKSGRLLPWRTAAEIIDWSLPCPSIFERKKPLAENTMKRIARGIQKFVIDNPEPFIIQVNHSGSGGNFRGQDIYDPMQTITGKNGWGIVSPYIARIGQTGFSGDRMQYPMNQPLTTIVTKAEHLLVAPTLIQTGYGERDGQAPRVPGLDKPLGTVVAGGQKHALIAATISRQFGKSVGHELTDPLGTITAGGGGKSQLVAAFLSQYHGEKSPTEVRGQMPDDPIQTIDTSNRYSLITAFMAKHYGGRYKGPGNEITDPLSTVTSVDHNALVTSHLVKLRGTCQHGQPITEPMPTITAGGLHIGEVRAFLLKYYGTNIGQGCNEPLQTITTKHRFGLVTVQGVDYQIVDIGMRMLEPHELFAAQGFPASYIIDRDHEGKAYPKAAQVARCGNAVPPPFAEALVRANLPELCQVAA